MTICNVDNYRLELNGLAVKFKHGAVAIEDLLRPIEERLSEAAGEAQLDPFFRGELAYFRGQYDLAIKYYLQANTIHNFAFYCYRASAALFLSQGNREKAFEFTKKALRFYPDDYSTLIIHEALLQGCLQEEDLQEIRNKIKALEKAQDLQNAPQKSPSTARDPIMNTGTDIFSSPKVDAEDSQKGLTERLYTENKGDFFTAAASDPYRELQRLSAASQPFPGVAVDAEPGSTDAMELRIRSFQNRQVELTRGYIENSRKQTLNDALYYLHGWSPPPAGAAAFAPFFLSENSRKASGGLFIRWNGKGIAVNPGPRFLDNFHEQGLTIRDIDFVIVTDALTESYEDIRKIYDLNHSVNKVSSEIHIIHYYLNQKAFQELSRQLKPQFKQERHSLHLLELFVDSPDVERVELAPGISLNFSLASSRDTAAGDPENPVKSAAPLAIRLDLSPEHGEGVLKIGYVTHSGWNSLLGRRLGKCDILVAGFGNTDSRDYNRTAYNPDTLGYSGVYSLLEEVLPSLLLVGEFNGREGDIRLEVAQKLRHDFTKARGEVRGVAILPADNGCLVDLATLQVRCSVTGGWIPPAQAQVVKTAESFGKLDYLSPSCRY